MTSDSDDLDTVLRQNLRLRRQLGAQVAKARKGSVGRHLPKISNLVRREAKRSAISLQDVVLPFETCGTSPHEPASPSHRQSSGRLSSTVGAVETASDNTELEGLRRELTLRRLVAAEVPKAGDSGGNQSDERFLSSAEAAETASDTEDLGELRRQLKLRREVGTERTKATDRTSILAKRSDKIAFSSGWILYGTCLAIAVVSAILMLRLMEGQFHDGTLIVASVTTLVFYGIGRDFLYALSGREAKNVLLVWPPVKAVARFVRAVSWG